MTIRIEEICDGEIQKAFEQEMGKVLSNILDDGTDPKATRAITINLRFSPTPDRSGAEIEVETKSKLAPRCSHMASVRIEEDENGEIAIQDVDRPVQGSLFGRDSGPCAVESVTFQGPSRPPITLTADTLAKASIALKAKKMARDGK